MRSTIACLSVLAVLAAGAALTAGPRRALKVSLKAGREMVEPGESALIAARLKNRTRDEVEATLRFFHEGDDSTPFATENLSLAAKGQARLVVSCPVPADWDAPVLRVSVRTGDGSARTRVRVKVDRRRDRAGEGDGDAPDEDDDGDDDDDDGGAPPPATGDDPDWTRGRDLYLASCSACHGVRGDDIRREDLEEWIEVVAEGEDDEMPAFPGIAADDVRRMRRYVLDPDRDVPEPTATAATAAPAAGNTAPTWDGSVQAIMNQSCVACHGPATALGNIRVDSYAAAFPDRAQIVDSVEKSRMPPGAALSTSVKATLRQWLDAGAPEN